MRKMAWNKKGMARTPKKAHLMALLAIGALLAATACSPPVPHGATTGFSKVCAFDGIPIESVVVTIVETETGGWFQLSWLSWLVDGSDSRTFEVGGTDPAVGDTFVAGAEFPLPVVDPGLCLHLDGSEGVVYQATAYPVSDPEVLLAYAVGARPGALTNGWPPDTN